MSIVLYAYHAYKGCWQMCNDMLCMSFWHFKGIEIKEACFVLGKIKKKNVKKKLKKNPKIRIFLDRI